jgi:hypothetical protein
MGRIIDTKLIEQFVKRMDELEEKIDALTEFYTDRGEEAVAETAKDNLNRMLGIEDKSLVIGDVQMIPTLRIAEGTSIIYHDGWHSVEEALPARGTRVLVYTNLGVMVMATLFDNGEWNVSSDYGKITHWCYLPTAPGKEEKI